MIPVPGYLETERLLIASELLFQIWSSRSDSVLTLV